VLTSEQAKLLSVGAYRQISPHLENSCLRVSANVSYAQACEDVYYLTGVRVPAKTQQRLVHGHDFSPPAVSELDEISVDGGKVRLRTPLGQPCQWKDYVESRKRPPSAEKNKLQPWRQDCWVIPPAENAEFVWRMEAVLEVYQTAYNPDIPVICIDEATKQLVRETQLPVAAQPGQPERIDYEYERNGTANLFMVCEPMVGWRRVEVTQQRTALDYAHLLKAIVDTDYPQADKLIVIQDNLNTHSPASLYKAFTPSEAQRILSRLKSQGHSGEKTTCHKSWRIAVLTSMA
jgi:hypothetical protein